MKALIANEPCGDGVLDGISKGEPPTHRDDMMHALQLASHHIQTHPALANRLYMTRTCERLELWSDTSIDRLDEYMLWRLAEWFRDIWTAILKLQEAVYKRGSETHKNSLLHDRPLQNQIHRSWLIVIRTSTGTQCTMTNRSLACLCLYLSRPPSVVETIRIRRLDLL
jgi:hypothetical protein